MPNFKQECWQLRLHLAPFMKAWKWKHIGIVWKIHGYGKNYIELGTIDLYITVFDSSHLYFSNSIYNYFYSRTVYIYKNAKRLKYMENKKYALIYCCNFILYILIFLVQAFEHGLIPGLTISALEQYVLIVTFSWLWSLVIIIIFYAKTVQISNVLSDQRQFHWHYFFHLQLCT